MTAHRWRTLTFLHWRVDPARMRPLVPPPLELDLWGDSAWIGLVLFTMPLLTFRGLKFPTANAFHETNVRTYVRHGGERGVYFFSLDAASALAVIGARSFVGLPYHHAKMDLEERGGVISYKSVRRWPGPKPAHTDVAVRLEGSPEPAAVGTAAHFFLERYHLFTVKGGKVKRGTVVHPPYPMQPAALVRCDESLIAAAQITVAGPPDDVRFSPGVDVDVLPLVDL